MNKYCTRPKCLPAHGILIALSLGCRAKGATVLLLKSFDDAVTTYSGAMEKAALRAWVELTGSPTYAILDQCALNPNSSPAPRRDMRALNSVLQVLHLKTRPCVAWFDE